MTNEQSPTTADPMLARRWAIAAQYREPADYDIPALPNWVTGRDSQDRLCFCDEDAQTPFIVAENPVTVRR